MREICDDQKVLGVSLVMCITDVVLFCIHSALPSLVRCGGLIVTPKVLSETFSFSLPHVYRLVNWWDEKCWSFICVIVLMGNGVGKVTQNAWQLPRVFTASFCLLVLILVCFVDVWVLICLLWRARWSFNRSSGLKQCFIVRQFEAVCFAVDAVLMFQCDSYLRTQLLSVGSGNKTCHGKWLELCCGHWYCCTMIKLA